MTAAVSSMFRRQIAPCPECEKKTRQVVHHTTVDEPDVMTCCDCAGSWADGQLVAEPVDQNGIPRYIWAKQTVSTTEWDTAIAAELAEQKSDHVGQVLAIVGFVLIVAYMGAQIVRAAAIA